MRGKCVFVAVFSIIFSILSAANCFAQDADFAPVNVRLVRATYTKITIKWQAGSSATQAASYKILRNNSEVGTSTETQYADTNLQAGTEYIYKIIAVSSAGENSPASAELKVKTIKSVAFDNSDKVEQMVDQLHDTSTSTTALSLITAIKSGLEGLLNTNISYTCIDSDILNDFVAEELAVIQEVAPEMTAAERAAAQAELNNLLNDSFGGNTFEHVYIHSKLTQLAEKHWAAGHKTAAKALYDFSLKYLSDQENYVFNSLARLARFERDEITDTSTNAEIAAALHAHRDQYNRFFDFFATSTSSQAVYARHMPAVEYFKYFPKLLPYSTYDQSVFTSAQQGAQAALNLAPEDNNEREQKLFEKVDAWELVNQKLTFKDSAGNPVTGTIKVKNITADTDKKYYFYSSEDAFVDEREFTVSTGEAIVPAYKGHIYEMSFSFNVAGGNPIKFTTVGVPTAKGKVATYDNFAEPVLADGTAEDSKTVFVVDHPTSPYNLTSTPAIDVFNLSWDWTNSASFTATHFKVFRGTTEIADVTGKTAANIPLESPDGISSYTVVAYDAANNASPASRELVVVPGDQTPYADYFVWMQSYFGEQAMYSCDDPDGDGVSNYQEFINGTDPTRIPGPVPYLQQKTYTKITLQWDEFLPAETGISFKIYRNDVEVGTTTENSFTDTGLTPGVVFAYKVKAIRADGSDTEFSADFSLRTMKPETGEYASQIQQIVDQFNPIDVTQYTGASLVTAVKSGLEALLGTNITFTVVDNDILNDFVEEELTLIRDVAPPMTAAERLAAQTELTDMLNNSFGGNSFEHVYMHSKLSELAEKHWQAGHKTAAKALYECTLGYLNDQETYVFNSLARLGRFELEEITDISTNAEIITALDKNRDAYLRFFSYFENSTAQQALYAYRMPAMEYFKQFPKLLSYTDYNQSVFNSASQLMQSVCAIGDDSMYTNVRDRINAWELVNLKVKLCDLGGYLLTPPVSITIENVSISTSGNKVYPYDPVKKYIEDYLNDRYSWTGSILYVDEFYETTTCALCKIEGDSAYCRVPVYFNGTWHQVSTITLSVPLDKRTFQVTDGEITIPVYKGHVYNLTATINGKSNTITVNNVPHQVEHSVKYKEGQQEPVISNLPGGTQYAELILSFYCAYNPNSDTDGDGISDEDEFINGLDPLDPSDAVLDSDADGMDNLTEINEGYDPNIYTKLVYVDNAAIDDTGDGLSLATAKKTLAAAITVSQDSDYENIIMVAAGTYTGTGNKELNFGYGFDVKLCSIDGAATTIIDLNGDCFAHIYRCLNKTNWLDGFTIRNGTRTVLTSYGNILIKNCVFENNSGYVVSADNNLEIKNCTFRNNGTAISGRYIKIERCVFENNGRAISGVTGNSNVEISNSMFRNNNGAINLCTSKAIISGSDFIGNHASYGGAISFSVPPLGGSLSIENCRFLNNQADYRGGAISAYGNISLTNCLLLNNRSNGHYSDIELGKSDDNATIRNTTIAHGTSVYNNSCNFECPVTLTNNILQGNISWNSTITAENNCSTTDLSSCGSNNITSDPQLTSQGYLLATSPCIDSGTATNFSITDLDGMVRPTGSGGDIGCYEFLDSDSDGIPDVVETVAGLNPNDASDASGDKDGDTISNIDEFKIGTNINAVDSDNDNIADNVEIETGYDPIRYTKLVYVDGTNGNNINDGLTLANAKKTLIAAIDIIDRVDYDNVILVASGTYKGSGNKNLSFNGYAIKLSSIDGAVTTIIDLENSGRFLHLYRRDRYNVAGFTIKNGFTSDGSAAAIAGAQGIVKNCIFENNHNSSHSSKGGAISAFYDNSIEVINCKFVRNTAEDGGAIYVNSSQTSKIENCEFISNMAGEGGAFYGNVTVKNCKFQDNFASYSGSVGVGAKAMTNCLLLNNRTPNWDLKCTDCQLTNVTIVGSNGKYSCYLLSSAQLKNCVIQGNILFDSDTALTVDNCCTTTDLSAYGSNNITSDPLLTANGRLKSGSPCIDAGLADGAPLTDIAGTARPSGAGVDIGCYELVDSDADGMDDNWEMKYFGDLTHTATADDDTDGLTNLEEYGYNTNPILADTDSDGTNDKTEMDNGYDPLRPLRTVYVDNSRPDDSEDGLSLSNAKKTINAAVNICKNYEYENVVMVVAGTYTGDGNKNLDFDGYDIKLRSIDGAANTIIDLENNGRFLYLHTGENFKFDGFTVKNGNYTALSLYRNITADIKNCTFINNSGGAIVISSGVTKVENCTFQTNHSTGGNGGGVAISSGHSEFKNCKFINNQASTGYGGAISASLGSITVEGCTFQDNSAKNGGSLRLYNIESKLKSCKFSGNIARYNGGAFFSDEGGLLTIENCKFQNNSTTSRGGVGYISDASLQMTNCLLCDNSSEGVSDLYINNESNSNQLNNVTIISGNGENSCEFRSPTQLKNCIIQGSINNANLVANNCCTTTDLSAYGSNNITTDPLLTVGGRLKSGSPCIDAGLSDGAPANDIAGTARPSGAGVDIGCYELVDSDADGMDDNWEMKYFGDLTHTATTDDDTDGLTNLEEYNFGTNPTLADTDGDGLTDSDEINTYNTNPLLADTDKDGLTDGDEINTYNTNPLLVDSDEDGITDKSEVDNNLNPNDTSDASLDKDGDGISNLDEFTLGTNISSSDSDGDGLTDSDEINVYNTDPLKADSDGDGLTDSDEINVYNTDPLKADTDSDGIKDNSEIIYGLDPSDPSDASQDADGDGMSNEYEINTYKTDPNNPDEDGDGLVDGVELSYFGDLSRDAQTDEDMDGLNNLEESLLGMDSIKTQESSTELGLKLYVVD